MNTPRTDAEKWQETCSDGDYEVVSADFARQLETEVQELRAALENLVEFAQPVMEAHGFGYMGRFEKARAALAKVPK